MANSVAIVTGSATGLGAACAVDLAGRGSDHMRLQECCRALEAAQAAVEKLYGRWQELEAKQTPGS